MDNLNILTLSLMVVLSGVISFLISLWLIKKKDNLGLLDIPNVRSSHNRPTPKGGGVGIVSGILITLGGCYLIGLIEMEPFKYFIIMVCFFAVALLGFCSDRFNLSALNRLILQSLIALIMLGVIYSPSVLEIAKREIILVCVVIIFQFLWLVAITNFYNFMDGIDGLAAMQGIIAGIGIGTFGIILKDESLIPMGLVLTGASAGFLILNLTPAKIFMGDVGSYASGFYIASFILMNEKLLVPVALVLGVFIFDTVVTLMIRIARGERWYQAHRSHFYQRAVSLGYSHLQVTWTLSLISVLLTAMACLYLIVSPLIQIIIVFIAFLVLVSLSLWVILKERTAV